MFDKATVHENLSSLGSQLAITPNKEKAATKFISELYGEKNCTSLNVLCATKASCKVSPKRMTPTYDALHLLMVVYQLYIWKHGNTINLDILILGTAWKIQTLMFLR